MELVWDGGFSSCCLATAHYLLTTARAPLRPADADAAAAAMQVERDARRKHELKEAKITLLL